MGRDDDHSEIGHESIVVGAASDSVNGMQGVEDMRRRFGTIDMFDRDRGRFGDNEISGRVTGASNLVDVMVYLMHDKAEKKAIAVRDPAKAKGEWIWLPRSQIEYFETEPGIVIVTMPNWLAEKNGLL